MHDWFSEIGAGFELSAGAVRDLRDAGFVTIPGPVMSEGSAPLAAAYDRAVASASPDDVSVGSTTTQVHDFVNRGAEFDALYVYRPVLEACCRTIGQPFRLSTMLARTLRPHSRAQALHVDYERDADGWPMVGFIFMVDEFRGDNGATRFVTGSHRLPTIPGDLMNATLADYGGQVVACGPAAPSSFTTALSGTGIRRIRPASRAARYRAHTSGVKPRRGSTCPPACDPRLSPASARLQGIYWLSNRRSQQTVPASLFLVRRDVPRPPTQASDRIRNLARRGYF